MGIRISLEVTAATTFNDLYRFVDHARSADVDGHTRPAVERPDDAHTVLTLDLGDVDQLTRPALWLSATQVNDFGRALERELDHESEGDEGDEGDRQKLGDLLASLQRAQDHADE